MRSITIARQPRHGVKVGSVWRQLRARWQAGTDPGFDTIKRFCSYGGFQAENSALNPVRAEFACKSRCFPKHYARGRLRCRYLPYLPINSVCATVCMRIMRGRSRRGTAACMCSPRVAGTAWCVGDAEPDVEVAPEVAGGTGESGGKGITMRCEVGTLLRLKPTGYPSHCTLSAWATRR
jgi:hypothetical protein